MLQPVSSPCTLTGHQHRHTSQQQHLFSRGRGSCAAAQGLYSTDRTQGSAGRGKQCSRALSHRLMVLMVSRRAGRHLRSLRVGCWRFFLKVICRLGGGVGHQCWAENPTTQGFWQLSYSRCGLRTQKKHHLHTTGTHEPSLHPRFLSTEAFPH